MTKDEIIKLMKETGELTRTPFDEWCLRFANLVAERKREECAKVCENLAMQQDRDVRDQCAAAIRAMGVPC